MQTQSTASIQTGSFSRFRNGALATLMTRFVRWQRYRQIRSELLQYTDRELQDLGIAPADIDRVAREGAEMPN